MNKQVQASGMIRINRLTTPSRSRRLEPLVFPVSREIVDDRSHTSSTPSCTPIRHPRSCIVPCTVSWMFCFERLVPSEHPSRNLHDLCLELTPFR